MADDLHPEKDDDALDPPPLSARWRRARDDGAETRNARAVVGQITTFAKVAAAAVEEGRNPRILPRRLPRLNGAAGVTRVATDDLIDVIPFEPVAGDPTVSTYATEALANDFPLSAGNTFSVGTQPYYSEDGNANTLPSGATMSTSDVNPVWRTVAVKVDVGGFSPSEPEWQMFVEGAILELRRRFGYLLANGTGASQVFSGLKTSTLIGQTFAASGAGGEPTTEDVRKLIARCASGAGRGPDLLVTSAGGVATLKEVFKSDEGMSFDPFGARRRRELHIDGIPVITAQLDENEDTGTDRTSVYALVTEWPYGVRVLYRAPNGCAGCGIVVRPIRPERPDVLVVSLTAALFVANTDCVIRMEKVKVRRS